MWDMTTDPQRWLLAAALTAAYVLLCLVIYLRQRRQTRQLQQQAAALAQGGRPLLLAYASQTGQAQALAEQAALHLHRAGWAVQLLPLGQVSAAQLQAAERALFILSTYGEGDAPDNALLFHSRILPSALPLPQLQYGLLALGDSQYQQFCGFGRAVDGWLQAQGAQAWQPRIEADNISTNPAALAQWQALLVQHLAVQPAQGAEGAEASTAAAPFPLAAPMQTWTLAARQHSNPGSQGGAVYYLELAAPAAQEAIPHWQSGDLVDIYPPAPPSGSTSAPEQSVAPRSYSIASTAQDGRIHLLVRQTQDAQGRPGLASHWLTQTLALGEPLRLTLRPHPGFRLEDNAQRPLVLIGNGTGLAGLRGHIRQRIQNGAYAHWLLLGERQAAHDQHYGQELQAYLAAGQLAHLDWAFSRDGAGKVYVQDLLRQYAPRLRQWVEQRDAAIYVCGSLQSMAQDVDTTLRDILGSAAVDELLAQGRYRRDVY